MHEKALLTKIRQQKGFCCVGCCIVFRCIINTVHSVDVYKWLVPNDLLTALGGVLTVLVYRIQQFLVHLVDAVPSFYTNYLIKKVIIHTCNLIKISTYLATTRSPS